MRETDSQERERHVHVFSLFSLVENGNQDPRHRRSERSLINVVNTDLCRYSKQNKNSHWQ